MKIKKERRQFVDFGEKQVDRLNWSRLRGAWVPLPPPWINTRIARATSLSLRQSLSLLLTRLKSVSIPSILTFTLMSPSFSSPSPFALSLLSLFSFLCLLLYRFHLLLRRCYSTPANPLALQNTLGVCLPSLLRPRSVILLQTTDSLRESDTSKGIRSPLGILATD